jgi:hypothetical protein
MAEKKEQRTAEAEVYEQHEDESGRIRLDRKLTPEEAAAQERPTAGPTWRSAGGVSRAARAHGRRSRDQNCGGSRPAAGIQGPCRAASAPQCLRTGARRSGPTSRMPVTPDPLRLSARRP